MKLLHSDDRHVLGHPSVKFLEQVVVHLARTKDDRLRAFHAIRIVDDFLESALVKSAMEDTALG